MKKIVGILTVSFIMLACSSDSKLSVEDKIENAGSDLKELKKIKSDLSKEVLELNKELKKVQFVINQKDTFLKKALITSQNIKEEEFKHYVEIQGNVTTKQNLIIYPESSGMIKQVLVREGTRVSKGQLLAVLDDNGRGEQLAQTKIQTELAKTVYERKKRLWDQKIGSQIDFLQAEANYKAQERAVAQIEIALSKTRVVAPFSGVIDQVLKEKGQLVAAGQGGEMFRIINMSNMYITANLPEVYLKNVSKNKEVLIDFPVLGKQTVSKIRQVGNYINPTNRSFSIEVPVSSKKLAIKPNMTAKLNINDYTNKNAVTIPLSVISESANGKQYVYIIIKDEKGNKTAKKQFITTGKSKENLVEVVEGLKDGDQLIVEGARTIRDGQFVEILK